MKLVLGILDLACVIILLFFSNFNTILLISAFYLIIKGLTFAVGGDIISIFDIVAGSYFILVAIGISFFVADFIVGAYLLQKGVISLF